MSDDPPIDWTAARRAISKIGSNNPKTARALAWMKEIPAKAFDLGAGGGAVPTKPPTPGNIPQDGPPPTPRNVYTPPPFAEKWPLADAAVEYIAEQTGFCPDDARTVLNNWMREETVKSRGEVGLVAPKIIQLTMATWAGLLPLAPGSIAYGIGGGAFDGKAISAIRVYAPDVLAAVKWFVGESLPPTQPAPAAPQAAANATPAAGSAALPAQPGEPPADKPIDHAPTVDATQPVPPVGAQPAETPAQPSEAPAEKPEPKLYTPAEYAKVEQYCRDHPGAKLVAEVRADLGSHKAVPGKAAKAGIPWRHIHAAWADVPEELKRKPEQG